MYIGLPELVIMVALMLALNLITARWRPAPPPLPTRLLVMVFCLAALAVSQAFPAHRGLSEVFLFLAMTTGVLSGFLRASFRRGEER